MAKRLFLAGFVAVGCAATAHTAAYDGLQPGLWKQDFSLRAIDRNGHPTSAPANSSETECYSADDVANPARFLLAGAEDQCEIANLTMHDGKVSMLASCRFGDGTNAVRLAGGFSGTYSGTTFRLSGQLRATDGRPVAISATMSAQRIGTCPAPEPLPKPQTGK